MKGKLLGSHVLDVILVLALFLWMACKIDSPGYSIVLDLSLDQEENIAEGKALTSSTQSINRYHSVLRDFTKLGFDYFPKKQEIALSLGEEQKQVLFHHIDSRFLVPFLPYSHARKIDDFDKANLLLAEFARSGISLSFQDSNTSFGYFNSSPGVFNKAGEYQFLDEEIRPNPKVQPKRFSIVNNCLNPCLWELKATDAVGEIYHAWFTLPQKNYFQILKDINGIENEEKELADFLNQTQQFPDIPLDLDRLRSFREDLYTSNAQVAFDKELGAYSSQDSRRKVQRGFYEILRDDEKQSIQRFSDLQAGDVFSLHSFVPPGVYKAQEKMKIPYQPNWDKVTFSTVEPKTSYGGQHDKYGQLGYLEIELFNRENTQSIIAGNIPIQLLVLSEDYKIPAFGAGVWNASEPIERRFLRLREGTFPHYAYLAKHQNGQRYLINNHDLGYEQIFLRPFNRDGQLFLRMTVVSYERIVDLLEFEFPIDGELAKRIRQASLEYQPPIYEVYQDSNIL